VEARLRVALVAGTLGQGGAEKQLVYMARALGLAGAEVRVYCLTRGEHHETTLRGMGIEPVWIGRVAHPAVRVVALACALRDFAPHVVQATHAYTNLYATLVAPLYRAVAVGAIRSDVHQERGAYGGWTRWLLRMPPGIIANSHAGAENAAAHGVRGGRVVVIPNVIDLAALDRAAGPTFNAARNRARPIVVAVATFVAVKRLDRFLHALALARRDVGNLEGVLVGDGPEEGCLQRLAAELGLLPAALRFVGRRDPSPVLQDANIMLLTSDHEGFPNVLLEGMAASLPIVTTPAGDSGTVVVDGVTGYVVPFDDVAGLAERLVRLTRSPELRRALGRAGRLRVEQEYGVERLPAMLLAAYATFARVQRRGRVSEVLRTLSAVTGWADRWGAGGGGGLARLGAPGGD